MAKEDRLLGAQRKKDLLDGYKKILFASHLFWEEPVGGDPIFERNFGRARFPFDFCVARRKDEKCSEPEWRYLKLLELLHEEKDRELRWLLIARWLKHENVCEPDLFLPKTILERLALRYLRSWQFSISDMANFAVVRGWQPYFLRLRSDLQQLRRKGESLQEALEKIGYEPAAIKFAITKKKLESVILSWIAGRRNLELHTLRNAYSRTAGRKRKRRAAVK